MHKFILWFFKNLHNVGQTFSVFCAFFTMLMTFYWVENILNTNWDWLMFFKPVLNYILDFSEKIFTFNFSAFGATYDGKFVTAIIMLLLLTVIVRAIINAIQGLKDWYMSAYLAHKMAVEKSFNRNMITRVKTEETRFSRYMVLINTKLQKKFSHAELNINVEEENKKMNNFIFKKTNAIYSPFEGGFLYKFDDFGKVDDVLDVVFKMLKSFSRLDYAVCVQVGEDFIQLKKLSDLNEYGKIIFCADTLLRYKFNKSHRYGTQNVGVFQKDNKTIEVHEFQEIL